MYHVGRNGQRSGPFTLEQLRAMAAKEELRPTDLVWKEGMVEWVPASTVPEIFLEASGASETSESGQQAPAMGPRLNPMALIGLMLGVVSITFGLFLCRGFPFSITGLVISLIALNQIQADPVNQLGRGMAVGGLWCSLIGIGVGILFLLLGIGLNVLTLRQ